MIRLLTLCLLAFVSALGRLAAAPELPVRSSATTTAVAGAAVLPGTKNVVADSYVYGGAYIAPTKAYSLLARVQVPDSGDPLAVWIHYRGLALQMKTKIADKNVEFPWNWSRHPNGFAWRKVGVFSRAELGPEITFICDTRLPEGAGVDAVVITADLSWDPAGKRVAKAVIDTNPDAPDAANAVAREAEDGVPADATEPGSALVKIDWRKLGESVPRALFSVNSFRSHNPAGAALPLWQEGIAYLNPSLVRLHNAGLVKTWFDEAAGDWKYDLIRSAVEAGAFQPGREHLLNINGWPPSFDADGDRRLDPDRLDDFARICADLVRFINIELKAGVRYWEVTNEKDFAYWRKPAEGNAPDVAALARIYNAAAKAMRAVDPSISVGGPAACSPLPSAPLIEFAKLARDQLDFLSFHHYASGNADDRDQQIFEKARVMAEDSADIVRLLRKAIPDKAIEVHLNEYNICYNWRIADPRMRDHRGAVFDALVMIGLANVPGMSAANAWNDRDRVYGKMDNAGTLRPAAHVYHYFNTVVRDRLVSAESDAPKAVVPFGTGDAQGRQTLVLVNRTAVVQTVTLAMEGAAADGWRRTRVYEGGLSPVFPATMDAAQRLEPYSVTFFWRG
jgi:Alpha-L-arabinofuranosidase